MPQFLVLLLNSDAFCTSTTGGYVSSRNSTSSPKAMKPIKELIYSVHLHPKLLLVTKPPMNGASSGPINTVAENTATASPRLALSNISAKTAATTAKGQEPKRPAKKRQMRIVWRFLATATAMEKMEKPNAESIRGGLRP